jgi:hypothetical protein
MKAKGRSSMSQNNAKSDHEIGYSKPPINTRFPKGISGNPAGRPAGKLNMATLLQQALQKKTIVKSKDGVRKVITIGEAIANKLAVMALSGDLAAIRLVINSGTTLEDSSPEMPKKHFNKSNQLLEGNGSTAPDSVGYMIPDPVLARRTLALLENMYGVKIDGRDPILIIKEEMTEELRIRIRKIYGFAVTPDEALRLANDGILIKASESETRTAP